MKSKTIFAVLIGGAGAACCLTSNARAAEVEPSQNPTAPEMRPSLQISSEVAPDFLSPAPTPSISPSPRAQWIENPLLKAQKNNGAWRDSSAVQLLDAPQMQGFEIEILPAQSESLQMSLSQRRAAAAASAKFPIQTQQAAKIAVERAQLLERAGVPIMAGAQLRRAVALAPRDIASRRALAQWTAQHEQWPEAAAQWREVLFQLQVQSAAPEEMAARENWRAEATRELRSAQNHLMAFWQVPNVVTLGADSQNPSAHSTATATQPTAITVAATSSALSSVSAQTTPLVVATPQSKAEPVKSAVENVLAAPSKRAAQHEIRFDIVVTSSSYLRPQKSEKMRETASENKKSTTTDIALDSSREQARLLSMQRQLQPWLGDIVHLEVGSDNSIDTKNVEAAG